jgi:general secretion pathway protein A
MSQLFLLSRGIPRLINIIADRALLGAYALGETRVTPGIIKQAALEALGEPAWSSPWLKAFAWGSAAVFLLLASLVAWNLYGNGENQTLWQAFKANSGSYEPARPVRRPIPPATRSTAPGEAEPKRNDSSAESALEAGDYVAPMSWGSESLAPEGWIPNAPAASSEAEAFRALFERWNVESLPAGAQETPCKMAEKLGFRCLTAQGTLQDLARLNHPAVLKLFDSGDQPFLAALVGIQGPRVTLIAAGVTHEIDQAELQKRWRGDYTLLWRPPPQYRGQLQIGDKGQGIAWVRLQLSILQGKSEIPAGEAVYDEAMVDELKRFQKEQGLEPDGLAGPLTLIRLNALTGLDVPLLTPIQQGG